MITVEYCNDKGCARDCAHMNIPCKREGYYIYDTASEMWFAGTCWASDWEDAKKYRSERNAMQATIDPSASRSQLSPT